MKIRIATWNLERPKIRQSAKLRSQSDQLKRLDADIWILTETNQALPPGEGYHSVASEFVDSVVKFGSDERRTMIWSRFPLVNTLTTNNPESAACAIVSTPKIELLLYGVVLPYHAAGTTWSYHYRGKEFTKLKQWQLHYTAIDDLHAELSALRDRFPNHGFCFGGDLNQSRDGRRYHASAKPNKKAAGREYYGTKEGREKISTLLHSCELTCVTDGDYSNRGLADESLIDHLCFDLETAKHVTAVEPFVVDTYESGKKNSDHSGVVVTLEFA